MRIKDVRQEERVVSGKKVRVTVVEREPTPEERIEQRLAALESRIAALDAKLDRK